MVRDVLVVPTGTANTASVLAGLSRCGAQPVVDANPERIAGADRVVLPGVGALAAAMDQLRRDGLAEALQLRIRAGRPTLAICLGLQLLCDGSDESLTAPALGLVAARAEAFPTSVTVPQMGWNRVDPVPECRYVRGGYAYFANSYRLPAVPAPWQPAWAEHGGRFVAAFEQGDVLACQFHPELSGTWGQDLLTRWLNGSGGGAC